MNRREDPARRSFPIARVRPAAVWVAFVLTGLVVLAAAIVFPHSQQPLAQGTPATPAVRDPIAFAAFEPFLAKHRDLTYDQLVARLGKPPRYLDRLSFDPTQAKYYREVKDKLALTANEIALFEKNGLVSIDPNKQFNFAAAYYEVFAKDLPVLVTSDSILHALHRSYDDMLMELEETLFTWTIEQILKDAHDRLAKCAEKGKPDGMDASFGDVDLYLTVARNLLAGAGAEGQDEGWIWDGKLLIRSQLGSDAVAEARLADVKSLRLQVPPETTEIYGGRRPIDYSQFRPRGHYTKSPVLRRYFRAMMWLGRADCGWNVLPPDSRTGIVSDSHREMRNAALLVELLDATGGLTQLRVLDDLINLLVGRSDNFTVFALRDLLRESGVSDLGDAKALDRLEQKLKAGKHARPMIRSQVMYGERGSSPQVPPPALFQMFGQRFLIDSFVLSQVVFDAIQFQKGRPERMMPMGLDVMAALGNDEAVPLLKSELKQWKYAGNLMACRDFVGSLDADFWKENLYNLWLGSLRTLDDDMSGQKYVPEAMKTRVWQHKQLQTQLASWAELRHDTILYGKQSYSGAVCEYPAGYVEPYPEFYAKVRFFAEEAGRRLARADGKVGDEYRDKEFKRVRDQQVRYYKTLAETTGRLEGLAKKELKAEPFNEEEKKWIKGLIRSAGCVYGQWDGWYCHLFYKGEEGWKWAPMVADVHTDPNSGNCLEVAVGDANLLVVAVDSEKDRAVYVGPAYSYYEFHHPAEGRLTDERWQQMITEKRVPPRPTWTGAFQAPARAVQAPARKR